jgi:hypothetical protein
MKKSKASSNSNPHADLFLKGPAYPKTGSEVVRELKTAIHAAECPVGQDLDQKEFARLIGAPKSTVNDWFHGKLGKPIERVICALERLSEPQRMGVLRKLCRDCPRLQHPRVAQDPQVIRSLSDLLAQPTGMIFVTGPSDELRTFVITAIGNSLGQIAPERTVSGIDVHTPEEFVPVAGVHYLRERHESKDYKSTTWELYQQLCRQPTDIVLLNGVWSILPDLRDSVIALAEQRSVIIADDLESWPSLS